MRIQFDIESNAWTQFIIWVTPTFSYVQSQPNPQPIGLYHYDFTFTYTQPTLYAVEFRTIPNWATWMKLDNIVLTDLSTVGVPELQRSEPGQPEYYKLIGDRLPGPPEHGIWFVKTGSVVKKYMRP